MSRKSRRFRRALVLLNLMVSGYNVAAVWAMRMLEARGERLGSQVVLAVPQALLATGLAFALLRWSPPRAPRLAIQLGVGLQAAVWAAAIAGMPLLHLTIAAAYAAVALWLATRTFLAGEPTAH
jgi:hypothetical protein